MCNKTDNCTAMHLEKKICSFAKKGVILHNFSSNMSIKNVLSCTVFHKMITFKKFYLQYASALMHLIITKAVKYQTFRFL